MTRGWGPYRSPPKLKDRFYKTIILADAIKAVRPLNRQLKSADLATEHPLDREEEVFRRFIDKLAQFCDSRMGGPTVTAVAVLESAIGPLFVLASNQRTTKADRAVAEFVASLLRQVRELGETEPGNDSWAAKRDRLLEDVIAFNKTRIADLIKKVRKTAVTSLSALADDTTPGASRLAEFLTQLRDESYLVFRSTSAESSPRSSPEPEGCQAAAPPIVQHPFAARARVFVSRIGRIHDANATSEDAQSQSLLTLLSARCNTEDPESCWYQLRHMLGRLRSYPSGIGPLLRAHARFPRLFDSPRVKVLPAHPVDPRPIRNGQPQTAESILSYMLPPTSASDEASSEFKRYAGYLRDIDALAAVAGGRDLNTSIAERWVTLKPLVHAEIALVDWLRHTNPDDNDDDVDSATPTEDDTVNDEDDEGDGIGAITRRARRITNTSRLPPTSAGNDGLRATRFFGGWAYVGSSKGPCRLCEYYLATLPESARVTMRHGHGNLYAPWRLPDPPLENDNDFRSVSLAERRTIPAGGTTERDLRALVREQMAASQRARDAALRAHDLTLDEILHRLRRDVLRDLEERCAPRRRFDSSTLTRTVATRVLSGGDDGSVIGLTPATNGDSEPSVAADDDGTPGVSNRRDHVVRGGGSGSVDGSNDSYDDSLWKSMSYLTLRRAQHAASPEGAAFAETASVLGEDGEWDRH